jgi:methionyl-tRNA formyltransferase
MRDGVKLYLWKSAVFTYDYYRVPGMVARILGGEVIVTCGRGAIRLSRVRIEGPCEVDASSVLKYGMRLE